MIIIRASEWRIRILGLKRRLRGALPLLGHLGAASGRAVQMGKGLRREVMEAYASRPNMSPRRDTVGRRLRSSAYQYGPSGRPRPPRGPSLGVANVPVALKLGLVGVVGAVSFLGTSSAYISFTGDLPDVHAITSNPIPEDSIIFAADGTELADIHQNGLQHYWENLNAMGTLLPQATVAIEDANF